MGDFDGRSYGQILVIPESTFLDTVHVKSKIQSMSEISQHKEARGCHKAAKNLKLTRASTLAVSNGCQ